MERRDSDRRPAINSLRAVIRIQTPPEYDPRTGAVLPGQLFGFDTAQDGPGGPGADLLAVTTSKKLNEPCGRFTLTMAPRDVIRGSTWADLIPAYSLVEIWLQSYPIDPQPVLVMLGLTDTNLQSEDYGQAQPQRQVQIAGRELSCIFVDQKTLYLPVPPEQLEPQRVSGLPELPALFAEAAQLLGMAAIDPELAFEGASPVDAIDRFFQMVTVGLATDYNPKGVPLLNLDLPVSIDPSTNRPTVSRLRDLLVFDVEKANGQIFDPSARLPAASQLVSSGVPLWSLMQTFSDPAYQELFAQTVDLRQSATTQPIPARTQLEAVELVFRKKPFAGRIDEQGRVVNTRAAVGSQFDVEFEADASVNLRVTDGDVVGQSLTRGSQGAVNLYYVYPQNPSINSPEELRALYAPLIDDGTYAPSSVRRLGLRLMQVADYYFRDGGSANSVEVAQTRARLLWHWHRFNPLFWRGHYTIRGKATAKVGMRMVDLGRLGAREFYVAGVTHGATLGGQQPRFTTRLEVERGWPIQTA